MGEGHKDFLLFQRHSQNTSSHPRLPGGGINTVVYSGGDYMKIESPWHVLFLDVSYPPCKRCRSLTWAKGKPYNKQTIEPPPLRREHVDWEA